MAAGAARKARPRLRHRDALLPRRLQSARDLLAPILLSSRRAIMHLTLLSRGPQAYTTSRLTTAARQRGWRVRVLDPLACEMHIDKRGQSIFYRQKRLSRTDVLIPRIAHSINMYGLAVVNQFTTMGVPALNDAQAIAQSRNKMRTLQLLSSCGIDVPATVMAAQAADLKAMVRRVGGMPVIVRRLQAQGWAGVMVAEDLQSMEAVLETMLKLGEHLVIQQHSKSRGGMDIRVLVVGGRAVCAVRRSIRTGRFFTTLKSGKVVATPLTERTARLAESAARIVGLEVAGVDMLDLPDGPRVFDLHSSPGLKDLEEATGMDLARPILDRAAEVVRERRSGGKQRAAR